MKKNYSTPEIEELVIDTRLIMNDIIDTSTEIEEGGDDGWT